NVCSDDPPVVYFSASQRQHAAGHRVKDSVRNVLATREFVVNIVSADLLDQMVATSASLDPEGDEFELTGLETSPSISVRPHRVAAARAALECRLHSTVSVGAYQMILGQVVTIVAQPGIVTDARVDVTRLQPVGRLNASLYTLLGEIV